MTKLLHFNQNMAITEESGHETPFLDDEKVVDSCIDYKGRPVHRYNSGGCRSATFIIGGEVAERFSFYGIESNLITFLTGPLGQSTATAAENVDAWAGTASLLPLLGGILADSFLGRYRTILFASAIYILISLMDKTLRRAKPRAHSSIGGIFQCVQDNIGCGFGFGIPCLVMAAALLIFLARTKTYRYSIIKVEEKSVFLRIGRVLVATVRNWKATTPTQPAFEEEASGMLTYQSSGQFKQANSLNTQLPAFKL
ncbi:hypothetical protein Tsubulata_050303, partial [Turnera subulata]